MGEEFTELRLTDYRFLERFLDATKANLFFAKGVILVEGWAEELLLPVLAKKIDINLTREGVSVVNIASTAFLRYSKVFQRKGKPLMQMPVAVVTDVDVQPFEAAPMKKIKDDKGVVVESAKSKEEIEEERTNKVNEKTGKYSAQAVKGFIAEFWTLEYCIALSTSLRQLFYKSVLEALREEKEDDGVADLAVCDTAIANYQSHFNDWKDNTEEIAYAIMLHILTGVNGIGVVKQKISKSVIAQCFARNLSEASQDFDLANQPSIQYLLNAIKYAASRI